MKLTISLNPSVVFWCIVVLAIIADCAKMVDAQCSFSCFETIVVCSFCCCCLVDSSDQYDKCSKKENETRSYIDTM